MSQTALYEELLGRLTNELNVLPDKPEETAESTLRALWHAAAGSPKSAELSCRVDLPTLDDARGSTLRQLVAQRLNGVPLAHLTGRQRFMDMEMLSGPDALIPRKETELLARAAIDLVQQVVMERNSATVVDICTGSGNVALAIAQHVPRAKVFAADISENAVQLARRNAGHLGLDKRAIFSAGDLLAPFDTDEFRGNVDVLSCNPPYINAAKVDQMPNEISRHEPSLAFNGGSFGVSILLRLLQEAPRFLRPGGWLISEVGLGQAPTLIKMLAKNSIFADVSSVRDHANAERVIVARIREN